MLPLDVEKEKQRSLISFVLKRESPTIFAIFAQISVTLARSRMVEQKSGQKAAIGCHGVNDGPLFPTSSGAASCHATLCMVGPLATNSEDHCLVRQKGPGPWSRKRRHNGGKVGEKETSF